MVSCINCFCPQVGNTTADNINAYYTELLANQRVLHQLKVQEAAMKVKEHKLKVKEHKLRMKLLRKQLANEGEKEVGDTSTEEDD